MGTAGAANRQLLAALMPQVQAANVVDYGTASSAVEALLSGSCLALFSIVIPASAAESVTQFTASLVSDLSYFAAKQAPNDVTNLNGNEGLAQVCTHFTKYLILCRLSKAVCDYHLFIFLKGNFYLFLFVGFLAGLLFIIHLFLQKLIFYYRE